MTSIAEIFITTLVILVTHHSTKTSAQEQRLPNTLVPELYTLKIKTYLDADDGALQYSFDGSNTVIVRCVFATNQITMHANAFGIDVEYNTIEVKAEPGGQAITVQSVSRPAANDMFTITLARSLAANERVSVLIRYKGLLGEQPFAFFRGTYQESGQTRTLAMTSLEPHLAHFVFPCFDDPALKANISLVLQHRKARRAWSNMPSASEKDLSNGWLETTFVTSPPMAMYTFSFVIASLQCLSKTTRSNVPISICGNPDSISSGSLQFAFDEAFSYYEYFENFFGIGSSLQKCDLMVIPNYQSLAQENWGLIYFPERVVALNQSTAAPRSLLQTTYVLSHEVSHMWYGDLVTFEWWNSYWMKEGGPIWFGYLGPSSSQPTWNYMQLVMENHYYPAMRKDELPQGGKLNLPDITFASMGDLLGNLNFPKGTALFRMLYGALGEKTFSRGLGSLFRNRAYGAITAADVWQALTDQARTDNVIPASLSLKDVMDTWTEQPGHPVLSVSRQTDGSLTLSQKRYLSDPTADLTTGMVSPYNFKWWIPISWASSSNGKIQQQTVVQWMGPTTSPSINVGSSPNWYLVNHDAYGFYRVQYDNENWVALSKQLRVDRTQIPTLTRAQLMIDSFVLNRAPLFLQFLGSMKCEQEYTVWWAADPGISHMMDILEGRPLFRDFNQFLSWQLSDQMSRIDMASSEATKPIQSRLMRPLIVARACALGMPECVTPALKLWANWKRSPDTNAIPEDIRSVVYCTALREGDLSDWNLANSRVTQAGYPQDDARDLRKALACTNRTASIVDYLNTIKQNNAMAAEDVIEILGDLFASLQSRPVAWSWLKDNLQWAQVRFTSSQTPFVTMMQDTLATKMTTAQELSELTAFGSFIRDTGAKAIFTQSLARVTSNMQWTTDNEEPLKKGLLEHDNQFRCGSGCVNATKSLITLALLFVVGKYLADCCDVA